METVMATLCIEVFVNCPHCDFFINLMDSDDTNGVDHNDCGGILREACPSGVWSDSHDRFELEDVVCSQCKGEFSVKQIEW